MYILFLTSLGVVAAVAAWIGHRQMFVSERSHARALGVYFTLKSLMLALIVTGAWGLLLAHPDTPQSQQSDEVIVMLVDVSSSMDVADMGSSQEPLTRKAFVREAIDAFLLEHPGHPMSIIVFAGEARTLLPVTSDPDLVTTFLGSLEAFNSLPGGSNFAQAFRYAGEYLERQDLTATVVMITDGGDEFVQINASELLNDRITQTIIYSVGSLEGGTIPDGYDPFGRLVPKVYQGQTVISKRNDQAVQQLAKELDGQSEVLAHTQDLAGVMRFLSPIQGQAQATEVRFWLALMAGGMIGFVVVTYGLNGILIHTLGNKHAS